jgi:hypothetical protein
MRTAVISALSKFIFFIFIHQDCLLIIPPLDGPATAYRAVAGLGRAADAGLKTNGLG